MAPPMLKMQGVSKRFHSVVALDKVDFNIYKGKTAALVGENGAGKSTLMKIVSGVYQRDGGSISLRGLPVQFANTKEAQDAGVAIIHQELNLIPELTAGENVMFGREPVNAFGKINWPRLHRRAENLLNKLGLVGESRIPVKHLSIGKRQMVEIAKALSQNAEIIIMDEPTDALTEAETGNLFRVINELKSQGKAIVYISHRLQEVFQIGDYVTVLRDGRFICEEPVAALDQGRVIELMVGRKLTEQYPRLDQAAGATVLSVTNLSNDFIRNATFELKAAEILGVAGLMGAGRSELAKSIFGAIPRTRGHMRLSGETLRLKSPEDAIKAGIVYVPEDRKTEGLLLQMSVRDNMTLSCLDRFSSIGGKINHPREAREVDAYIQQMSIKAASARQPVKFLSGGNQQKVSIAKSLMTDPKVLILDEPTRGVDVGAKKEIYDLINTFKQRGLSILLISSELPEIIGICDRVLVMHAGRVQKELRPPDITQENIMRAAVGLAETDSHHLKVAG